MIIKIILIIAGNSFLLHIKKEMYSGIAIIKLQQRNPCCPIKMNIEFKKINIHAIVDSEIGCFR